MRLPNKKAIELIKKNKDMKEVLKETGLHERSYWRLRGIVKRQVDPKMFNVNQYECWLTGGKLTA